MNVELGSRRLDLLVETFQDRKQFLVQTHNNPDPDSIASAMAVRYLIQRYTGRDAVLAYGGIIGRSENRAMVRELQVPMVPGTMVDYTTYDWTGVCDTQPGTNYTSFPEGFVPTVVIDHHEAREETKKAEFAVVERGYGATSSILAEMLLARAIPIPVDVATALYYGIKSETQDLCRDTSPADEAVYRELAKVADRKAVSRIETERVHRRYYRDVYATLTSARVHGDVVVADAGGVRVPDMVAEMADYLLRHEGMRWAGVIGEHHDQLYVSLRGADEKADAGEIIGRMLHGKGSSGGHPSMAGGQVPLEDLAADERAATKAEVLGVFLRETGGGDEPGKPLIPVDPAGAGDENG